MKKDSRPYLLMMASLVLVTLTGFSQVSLPQVISDGMVLQRDAEIRILRIRRS